MAYAQWATFQINVLKPDTSVIIRDVKLNWGKFYAFNDKDHEIKSKDIEGKIITDKTPHNQRIISACGRSDSASGTEGSFLLNYQDETIGKLYWDCPWGSKTNTCTWEKHSDNFMVELTGINTDSGALGNIQINIVKLNK